MSGLLAGFLLLLLVGSGWGGVFVFFGGFEALFGLSDVVDTSVVVVSSAVVSEVSDAIGSLSLQAEGVGAVATERVGEESARRAEIVVPKSTSSLVCMVGLVGNEGTSASRALTA